MKKYYLSRLSLQNEIFFFILALIYRYIKKFISVSCSAIMAIRGAGGIVDIYTDMYNNDLSQVV